MKIETQREGDTLVVDLAGELDAEGSAAFEERCLYEQQEGALHFIIELGAVERMTGPGLRVLLALARSLPRSGGSLVLCRVERRVEEALRVSGLATSFAMASDREAALALSKELRSTRGGSATPSHSDLEEKIAYAISLLRSNQPPALGRSDR
jgi:anti-anti-sigma factor